MQDKTRDDIVEFVVGEEKNLTDIVSAEEIIPLLQGAVKAGADQALLADPAARELWSSGPAGPADLHSISMPVYLEGEVCGKVIVRGKKSGEDHLQGLASLLTDALQAMITINLKRMLTTEIHTSVVNLSYEELVETNRKLTVSEARYRELAENLEKKVVERTDELQQALARLLQQEKMASIGQLAAGVAHEINNPLGFIASNLNTLGRYKEKITRMLALYREALTRDDPADGSGADLEQKWQELRLDFILADIDDLLIQTSEGCDRVKSIVADLKGFSHIDESEEVVVDLNQEIDRTLSVLSNRISEDVVIEKRYGNLPGFRCRPGLICQVFLNIIVNALQMKASGLRLDIETIMEGEAIIIKFTDNGPGMPDDVISRVFDPFFTTKDVGQGTGMGLTIAYDIINSHGGRLEAGNKSGGQGAEFVIILPSTGG